MQFLSEQNVIKISQSWFYIKGGLESNLDTRMTSQVTTADRFWTILHRISPKITRLLWNVGFKKIPGLKKSPGDSPRGQGWSRGWSSLPQAPAAGLVAQQTSKIVTRDRVKSFISWYLLLLSPQGLLPIAEGNEMRVKPFVLDNSTPPVTPLPISF